MKVDKFFKDVDEKIIGFSYASFNTPFHDPANDLLDCVHKTKCGSINYSTAVAEKHKELIQYFRTISRLNGDGQGWSVEHWLTRSGKYRRYAIRDGHYTEDLKGFFLDESR